MSITNPSFEIAGAGQGSADGWTLTAGAGANAVAEITAGDGLVYAWEDFSGWVSGQAEYRADGFEPGDTTAGTFQEGAGTTTSTETFEACRTDVAVQATSASSTIAAAGHDFSVNDPVLLTTAIGTALFSPFQKGITYYVKTIVAGVSVTLSATPGGSAITATADGEATMVGDPRSFWPNPISAW